MPLATVPQPGLTRLLEISVTLNEVKEVLKFLTNTVAHIGQSNVNPSPADNMSTKEFWDGAISAYPINSSISSALRSFGVNYLEHFEYVCRTHVGEETMRALTKNSDDPNVIQVKLWLIECACHSAADLDASLSVKLRSYRIPQPTYSPSFHPHGYPRVPSRGLLQPEVAGNPMPELARALYILVEELQESHVPLEEDDYYFVLREFFRLAMNCAQVWTAYGPENWNLELDGRPELSEKPLNQGLLEVITVWSNMIKNPFSDAPQHIRYILSQCDTFNAACHFLIDVRAALPPFLWNEVNMNDVTRQFTMAVHYAAARFEEDIGIFFDLEESRWGNFDSITQGRPNNEMLDALRQAPGEQFVHTGLPLPDVLDLPNEAELTLPESINDQFAFLAGDELVGDGQVQRDDEWFPPPGSLVFTEIPLTVGNQLEEVRFIRDPMNTPLMASDERVYHNQLEIITPPALRAIGPRHDPRQFGRAVQESDLHADDMCSFCTCGLLDDEDKDIIQLPCKHLVHCTELDELINGAYFMQSTVHCPLCRAEICHTRQTEQILGGMQ